MRGELGEGWALWMWFELSQPLFPALIAVVSPTIGNDDR
jgi:hypothetical protein